MSSPSEYFDHLVDLIIQSRLVSDIEEARRIEAATHGSFTARLRFHDTSLLEFLEFIAVAEGKISKTKYRYHYQRGEQVVFRYDNAPHHPNVETHPHHKHMGDEVLATQEPTLESVLKEIATLLE